MPAVASGRSVRVEPSRSSKGERGAVPVLEGVHLLGDDVGLGADPPREQLRLLEDGRAQLAVAVAAEEVVGGPLDAVPRRDLVRQDVVGALDGPDH
jgi:hypothetical protein